MKCFKKTKNIKMYCNSNTNYGDILLKDNLFNLIENKEEEESIFFNNLFKPKMYTNRVLNTLFEEDIDPNILLRLSAYSSSVSSSVFLVSSSTSIRLFMKQPLIKLKFAKGS